MDATVDRRHLQNYLLVPKPKVLSAFFIHIKRTFTSNGNSWTCTSGVVAEFIPSHFSVFHVWCVETFLFSFIHKFRFSFESHDDKLNGNEKKERFFGVYCQWWNERRCSKYDLFIVVSFYNDTVKTANRISIVCFWRFSNCAREFNRNQSKNGFM